MVAGLAVARCPFAHRRDASKEVGPRTAAQPLLQALHLHERLVTAGVFRLWRADHHLRVATSCIAPTCDTRDIAMVEHPASLARSAVRYSNPRFYAQTAQPCVYKMGERAAT